MNHVPGGTEQTGTRVHHAPQNGMQFKTYELFISGIFHLIFSDCSRLQVTETAESKTTDKLLGGGYCTDTEGLLSFSYLFYIRFIPFLSLISYITLFFRG